MHKSTDPSGSNFSFSGEFLPRISNLHGCLALKRIYYLIKLNTSIDCSKDSFFEDNLCMFMKPPTGHEGDIKLQSACWQAYYEGSSMLVCIWKNIITIRVHQHAISSLHTTFKPYYTSNLRHYQHDLLSGNTALNHMFALFC